MISTKPILKPLLLLLGLTWSCFLFATPVKWTLAFIQEADIDHTYPEIVGTGKFTFDTSKCIPTFRGKECSLDSISIDFRGGQYKPKNISDILWTESDAGGSFNGKGDPLTKSLYNIPDEWRLKQDFLNNTTQTLTVSTDGFTLSQLPSWFGEWRYVDEHGVASGGTIVGVRDTDSTCQLPNNNCKPAEYISNQSKLLISALKIGDKMYDATLKKKNGVDFTITKISRITDTTCQQAEYIPSEGRIKIPKLTINNKTYKTTLKKTSGNDFKIEDISPI